jgi:hypothetical protein
LSVFPDPKKLPQGTPERAVAKFLAAWNQRDWAGLVRVCQPEWVKTFPRHQRREDELGRHYTATIKAQGWLKALLGNTRMLSAEIVETRGAEGLEPEFAQDVVLRVCRRIQVGEKPAVEAEGTVAVRVLREDSSGPSPTGRWGVNPSTLARFTSSGGAAGTPSRARG